MELFARRDLYMYLVVLALLLPLPAAAQTVGKLVVSCPSNESVAVVEWFIGGGDLQCHHFGRRRTGDGIRDPRIGQHVPRRVNNPYKSTRNPVTGRPPAAVFP